MSKTMSCFVMRGIGKVGFMEKSIPRPGPNDAIIRTTVALIWTSDVLALRFDVDILMLLAAIGAAMLGDWAEGALLLFLFSLGHGLEQYAMGRAKRAIEALAELATQTALVRREGHPEVVPVEQLRVGDVVIVKPNERLPADAPDWSGPDRHCTALDVNRGHADCVLADQ